MTEPTVTLKEHFETHISYLGILSAANDRRYTEINIEKEKALKIKEEGDREARRIKDEADKTALGLAREIQKYKDEKANELREQINRERNLYVTNDKLESTIKPLVDYVSSQQGRSMGLSQGWAILVGAIGLALAIWSRL